MPGLLDSQDVLEQYMQQQRLKQNAMVASRLPNRITPEQWQAARTPQQVNNDPMLQKLPHYVSGMDQLYQPTDNEEAKRRLLLLLGK